MSDETKPKRVRGTRLLEQGYRAGFRDGFLNGKLAGQELLDLQKREAEKCERDLQAGLARVREAKTDEPKRTRRKRGTGADVGTGTNPTVIHDAVTGERTPYER